MANYCLLLDYDYRIRIKEAVNNLKKKIISIFKAMLKIMKKSFFGENSA
jgi:hypothetical protein